MANYVKALLIVGSIVLTLALIAVAIYVAHVTSSIGLALVWFGIASVSILVTFASLYDER